MAAGILFLLIATAAASLLRLDPDPRELRARNPELTSLMAYRMSRALEEGREPHIRHQWVSLDAIPDEVIRAVLVAEDHRFYRHEGVDWTALADEVGWQGDSTFTWTERDDVASLVGALKYVWRHRDQVKGRSTITQQLAKNLYFDPERSYVRKVREVLAARSLEHHLTKARILELYLNTAELGDGVFGVEAASRIYFGHSVRDTKLVEGATLAATLPHPLGSNPHREPGRMSWRRDLILSRLMPPTPDSALLASARVEIRAPELDLGRMLLPVPGTRAAQRPSADPPDSIQGGSG